MVGKILYKFAYTTSSRQFHYWYHIFTVTHLQFYMLIMQKKKKISKLIKTFFFSYSHLMFCSLFFRRLKLSFTASFILSNNITTLSKTTLFQHATPASTKMNEKEKEKNRPNWTNERRCKQIQQETSMNIRRDITIVKWKEMKDIRQPNSIMFGRGTSLSALYRFFQISLVDRTPLMAGDDDQRFSDISSILAVKLSQH